MRARAPWQPWGQVGGGRWVVAVGGGCWGGHMSRGPGNPSGGGGTHSSGCACRLPPRCRSLPSLPPPHACRRGYPGSEGPCDPGARHPHLGVTAAAPPPPSPTHVSPLPAGLVTLLAAQAFGTDAIAITGAPSPPQLYPTHPPTHPSTQLSPLPGLAWLARSPSSGCALPLGPSQASRTQGQGTRARLPPQLPRHPS